MSKDAAERRVAEKAADARSEPEQPPEFRFFFQEPESLSPLDEQTLDERRTQKFYEERRLDD